MNEIKLTIGGKEITVRKQSFRKQLGFIKAIPQLKNDTMAKIAKIDLNNEADVLAAAGEVLFEELETLAGYIVDLLDGQLTPKELIDELGLDEIMAVVDAIITVNNVKGILAYKKKVMGAFSPEPEPPANLPEA